MSLDREPRISVVDDCPNNEDGLYKIFYGEKCRLTLYRNPLEALEAFQSGRDQAEIWLIDRQMPQMGGFELAQTMRQSQRSIVLGMVTFGGESALTKQDEVNRELVDFIYDKRIILNFSEVERVLCDLQSRQARLTPLTEQSKAA